MVSDFKITIDEAAINSVVKQIMRQRPSLFCYATPWIIADPSNACCAFDVAPEVRAASNPIFTKENPLPIPGTNEKLGLEYCIQLSEIIFDFFPSNVIQMPQELNPPLKKDHLCIRFTIQMGLEDFESVPRKLKCFQIQLFALCSSGTCQQL